MFIAHPLSIASFPACKMERKYLRLEPIGQHALTMMVPAVWKRNGLSSLFCTTKFGRMATGGTSTTIATFILDYKNVW